MKLEVRNLHKYFGGIKALDGCSIKIQQGIITAIIGPNGSGKTTLFNVISKLLIPQKGDIYLDGKNITKLPDYKVAQKGIARTFQEVRLFQNLTVKEHIAIALKQDDEKMFKNLFAKKDIENKQIKQVLKLVGLDKPLDTYVTDLSYGQRKLLDLAIAIAKPHKMLLLDEPVAGVNPVLRKQIKQILKKLRGQGETIIIIEHDMNFVMDLADEVYVLDAGKVIAHDKPKKIQNNKKVLDAYLGE